MDKEKDMKIGVVGNGGKSVKQLLIQSLQGEKEHPVNKENSTPEICYIREHDEREHEEKAEQLLVYCPEFLEGTKFAKEMQEIYQYIELSHPPIYAKIDENGHITSAYMMIPKDECRNSYDKLNIPAENLITHPKEIEIEFSSHSYKSPIIEKKAKELLSKFNSLKEEEINE